MNATAMLTHELQNRAKLKPSSSDVGSTSVDATNSSHEEQQSPVAQNDESESGLIETSTLDPATSDSANFDMDKHPVMCTDIPEETSEIGGVSGTTMPLGNDEDVSFSDLEDDEGDVPSSYKKITYSDSSVKDSRDWVQLGSGSTYSSKDAGATNIEHPETGTMSGNSYENKVSSDWLGFDDLDSA
ncbi:hypothetical protein Ancab_025872 [Ancistrocladus abbreviatus]